MPDRAPPDPSYILFGAEALLKELHALGAEMDGVRQADDLEYVHRMRVATRRLRTRLALFGDGLPPKKILPWRKQARRLTKSLGAARDTDVEIHFLEGFYQDLTQSRHRPGIARLLLRLRQRRARLQKKTINTLDRLAADKLLEDMEKTLRRVRIRAQAHRDAPTPSPEAWRRARQAIAPRLQEMLGFEIYVRQPERAQELHQMRIAAKRFRYAMEVFASWFPHELKPELKAVRTLQDLLGDIHDGDVWMEYLPRFLEEERARALEYYGHARTVFRLRAGILYLEQERREFRQKRHQELVGFWDQLQEKELWKSLIQELGDAPREPSVPEGGREPGEEVPSP